jgi:hypothetical protein
VLDPVQYAGTGSCLRRSRMLYRSTGKEGGVPEIDEPADCDEPIEFSFEPHEDDVLRAFELCDSFSSWGEELRDSIEIVAAGLYEMRSTDPGFVARFGAETAVIAPFVTIEAPLTIDCHK